MNALDETAVRQQLHEAVDMLDPIPPPLVEVQARVARRKRTNRLAIGLGGVAIAGACALVATVVVAALPGDRETVTPASAPSQRSLVDFAKAHGAISSRFGRQISGPLESPAGFYGAFTVKSGVQVAKWNGAAWKVDGAAVTTLGPGRYVMRLTNGPQLSDMKTPTFYLRVMGGDISYAGSVLQLAAGAWAPVRFTSCGHHGLCPAVGSQPYAHPRGTGMVSVQNNCRPDCAGGSRYRVRWEWAIKVRPGTGAKAGPFVFTPARVHKIS